MLETLTRFQTEVQLRGCQPPSYPAPADRMTPVGLARLLLQTLRGKTTYGRSCSLGRVMPCSIVAEQRHKIIRKGVALVCEESVSGVTAELPPGRSGVPHHARLYHWHRRDHALPHGAGDTE